MIEIALHLEVEEYVSRHRGERDAAGHAVVVRNTWRMSGCAPSRSSESARTDPRKPSRWRTATGRVPRAGRRVLRDLTEIRRFTAKYGAQYPKAVAALTTDQTRLLILFDCAAEHWKHLRTTSPIESTFATVLLRERVTKGAGARMAGLTMTFELLEAAPEPLAAAGRC
jgi:hypothetical protein